MSAPSALPDRHTASDEDLARSEPAEEWTARARRRADELVATGEYPNRTQAWQAAYREVSRQQRRRVEDEVLAAAQRLDPADTSLEARLVRETAASIGEHRASGAARPQRPEAAGQPAAAGSPARLAATSFATPATSAAAVGTAADAGAVLLSARQAAAPVAGASARAAGGASHRRSR